MSQGVQSTLKWTFVTATSWYFITGHNTTVQKNRWSNILSQSVSLCPTDWLSCGVNLSVTITPLPLQPWLSYLIYTSMTYIVFTIPISLNYHITCTYIYYIHKNTIFLTTFLIICQVIGSEGENMRSFKEIKIWQRMLNLVRSNIRHTMFYILKYRDTQISKYFCL